MKERYHLLDGIRGLAVVSMMLFHFCYDLFIIYGLDPGWYWRPAIRLWQTLGCWVFLLLSGLCWHLGKRRVRSGLFINLCGLAVTAVTVLVVPGQAVWFGVLNLLGCALLLTTALAPLLEKVPWALGGGVSFLLFLLLGEVDRGIIGLGSWVLVRLPEEWYTHLWLAPLGLPPAGFSSSDYFPLLPWFFLYLTGCFLGRRVLQEPHPALFRSIPGMDWVGRRSLLIYMLHQPVCMALAAGASSLLG